LPTTSCDHKTGNLIFPHICIPFDYSSFKDLAYRSVNYLVYIPTDFNVSVGADVFLRAGETFELTITLSYSQIGLYYSNKRLLNP
jgi:hypothetical protein